MWWRDVSARDCGFRMTGTSVRLWGESISGAAATPSFYPLLEPELQVTISGVGPAAVIHIMMERRAGSGHLVRFLACHSSLEKKPS